MNNRFLKLSEIKLTASKKALSQNQQSTGSKVVKQIIGSNPLNKEWVDSAANSIKYALQHQGFQRVNALIQALSTLYFCDWVLKDSNFNDNEVQQLIKKAETSYLNSCLGYIEQIIHSSQKVINSLNTLTSAIDVISETNSAMAIKYKQMIARYQNLFTAFNKIKYLCNLPNKKFNKNSSKQIQTTYMLSASSFKMYPKLREDILEIIKHKIDQIYIETQSNIEKIYLEKEPSLVQIISILNNFHEIFDPLTDLLQQRRFIEAIEKREHYIANQNIITADFPEWVKVYEYYTLPRNRIDEARVYAVLNAIAKNSDFLSFNYLEIKNLSPSIEDIISLLKTLVSKQGEDSIVNYYKIENDILNSPDNDKKIEEIVRFIKHLNEKLLDRKVKNQLMTEILRLREEFYTNLDTCIEKKITDFLSKNNSIKSFVQFFDKILNYFYDINDLSKINQWQNTKKNLVKALKDVPEMIITIQNDFEFMNKLPDSTTKTALYQKIKNLILEVNNIIPTMALFQIGDVHNYLNIIEKCSNNVSLPVSDKVSLAQSFVTNDRSVSHNYTTLHVYDKFTTKNIIIFNKDTITIGRNESSDILLKSDWVSNEHCHINLKNLIITDNNSTNGTFYSDRNKYELIKITASLNVENINIINIANAFEMLLDVYNDYKTIKITKIFDTELLSVEKDYIHRLINTEFVWLNKFGTLAIDIFTGKIKEKDENNTNDLIIINDNNFIVIDQENSKPAIKVNKDENITTDRFNIDLI